MALDFYGIYISAAILLPNPQTPFAPPTRYELWLNNNNTDPRVPSALRDLAYVQDITIQIGLALNSKITMTLSPPFDEGMELIHSDLVNWARSTLRVTIGYSTGTDAKTQEFGGLMLKPDVRIGSSVSITLNAVGVAYGMNLSNATNGSFPAGTTPWDAVKKTFQDNNINIDSNDNIVRDSDPLHPIPVFPLPPGVNLDDVADFFEGSFFQPIVARKKSTQSEINSAQQQIADVNKSVAKHQISSSAGAAQIAQINSSILTDDQFAAIDKGARNDWWFVRETVKNNGLDLIIRDNVPQIMDPKIWKAGTPKYNFVLKGNIDTDNFVYPILEFNSPSSYVYLGTGIGGAVMADVDPKIKQENQKLIHAMNSPVSSRTTEAVSEDAPPPNAPFTPRGAYNPADPLSRIGITTGLALLSSVQPNITRTDKGAYNAVGGTTPTSNDAYQIFPGDPNDVRGSQVNAEIQNFNNNRGLAVEITSLGIPALLPGDVVNLEGITPLGTPESIGTRWDGLYGVMMVEHNIGTGGMSTKLKGLKNYVPGQLGTDGGQVSNANDVKGNLSTPGIDDYITKVPSSI